MTATGARLSAVPSLSGELVVNTGFIEMRVLATTMPKRLVTTGAGCKVEWTW